LRQWPLRSSLWGWKFQLLRAEDLISLSRAKEANLLLTDSGRPPAALLARWTLDRANAAVAAGETGKARQLLGEAFLAASASHDSAVLCLIILRRGSMADAYDEAETQYRSALDLAEHLRDPSLLARAYLNLGHNRLRFARFDAAIPFLDRALAFGRQSGAKPLIAAALGNLGWCYYRLGDLDRAMDDLVRAESLSREMGLRDQQQRWMVDIGVLYFTLGDLGRAAQFERQAAKVAEEIGNQAWLAHAYHNLAEISLENGDLSAARSYSQNAIAIRRRNGDLSQLVYSELDQAQIDASAREYTLAEREYQSVIVRARQADVPDVLWEAHASFASLYRQTHRDKLADIQFANAIDVIDREWSKLGNDEWKTTFLTLHLVGFFQDYVDFLIQTQRPEKALDVAESARARILNQRLEHRGMVPPALNQDDLLRNARTSQTVILSYWLEPARSSVWVIGSGRLSRFDLPPGKEIAGLVQKYTNTITQGGDPLAQNDSVSSALYQAVLAPVAKLIPTNSNVIVVPDGALHQLNFETLVVPSPHPHYWIEDVAIAGAPSLRVLAGNGHKAFRTPKMLLLGDPVITGQEFPPLPHVADEIAAVAAGFPQPNRVVLTGAAAVPEQYAKSSPASFTNIHFATHATANRESPLNSAIILSHQGENYKLYAREVADVPLTADLVTLSACTSAGAKAYSGEGLMGFAWAFLEAGAQNVVASLWDVDDASSVDIMRSLYKELAAGQPPARALRTAKLALLHSGNRGRLPYYWGPQQIFTREIGVTPRRHAPSSSDRVTPKRSPQSTS